MNTFSRVMSALVLVSALAFLALGTPSRAATALSSPQFAVQTTTATCSCPKPTYQRASGSVTLATDYLELDSDAGLPITVTLPAAPKHLDRHEVWLGAQPGLPGGTVTLDGNGQPLVGADALLDAANEGRVLLYVKPTPSGGGYWRVSAFN